MSTISKSNDWAVVPGVNQVNDTAVDDFDPGVLLLTADKNINSIIRQFRDRSAVGIKKYGTTTDREDLTLLDWLEHAKQEMMDGVVYLNKAIEKEKDRLNAVSTQEAKGQGEEARSNNGRAGSD